MEGSSLFVLFIINLSSFYSYQLSFRHISIHLFICKQKMKEGRRTDTGITALNRSFVAFGIPNRCLFIINCYRNTCQRFKQLTIAGV